MSNIYQAKGQTLHVQYMDVGRLFAKELQKREVKNAIKLRVSKKVLARVMTLPTLSTFYDCFRGWVAGAGISELDGMYHLCDNLSGCQTMMVRYKGGVGMLHTEEDFYDVQARLSKNHTIEFSDNGRILRALTYNDLMPGAGVIGWQADKVVAVDSLFLKEEDIESIVDPMLANIVAWQVWYMTPQETDPKTIVAILSSLGTMVDGYAINVIRRTGKKVSGYKVFFTRNDWEIEKLGSKVGDNLRQVNIIEPRYVGENRLITQWQSRELIEDYTAFVERLQTMAQLIEQHTAWWSRTIEASALTAVHQRAQELVFGTYATEFVNEWMGAACIALVDSRLGVSVSCKLHNEQSLEVLEYVDTLKF